MDFNPRSVTPEQQISLPPGASLFTPKAGDEKCMNDIIHLLTSLSEENEHLLRKIDSIEVSVLESRARTPN